MMSEMVSAQINLPRDMFELLKQRSEAQGLTLAQQILAVLMAYLEDYNDPILKANDPIFHIAGAIDSSVGDLSIHHDRYLYGKDWQEQSQGETVG